MTYKVTIKISNKSSSTTAVLKVEAKDKDEAQEKIFELLNNKTGANRVLEVKEVEQLKQ